MAKDQPKSSENRDGWCFDSLYAILTRGPLWAGDVPSRTGCDALIAEGYAVRVVMKGDDGFTAATLKGAQLFRDYLKVDTIKEGIAIIQSRHVIRRATENDKARLDVTRLLDLAATDLIKPSCSPADAYTQLIANLVTPSTRDQAQAQIHHVSAVVRQITLTNQDVIWQTPGHTVTSGYRIVQYLENPGVNSAHHVVLLWVRFGEPKRNAAVTSILPVWLNADQWELIDPIPDHHPLVRAAISDLVNNPYRKEDDDRSTSGSAG